MWYGQPIKWLKGNVHGKGVVWGCPPKNGSSSLRKALDRDCVGSAIVNPQMYSKRIFVFRDPMDRFRSLWLNKCRDARNRPGDPKADLKVIAGMTPEELYEYIVANKNQHWTPQIQLMNGLDCDVIRLDELPTTYAEIMGKPYPVANRSSNKDEFIITSTLERKVREYYREDLMFWEYL